ncbi:MAG: SpoIID/LytB domain-containing protein [Chloroflexi bacterium]|nr:MAG: SpoIID/LytB domain-containing protein [Chloroflexota bacterium]
MTAVALLIFTSVALAAPSPILAATYLATVPPQAGAGTTVQVPVTLTNIGSEIWNATGPNPVNLSYHWYDGAGAVAVWDGARTALGGDIAQTAQKVVTADVAVPAMPGPYFIRFALVKEGVGWVEPSGAYPLMAQSAFNAKFGVVTLPAMLAATSYQVAVPVTNTGSVGWPSAGVNLVDLSYHWHDASGQTVVWDGVRTPLPANVDVNGTVTVSATVVTPTAPGAYILTFDLVHEGVAWFGQLGSVPLRLPGPVQPSIFAAAYAAPTVGTAFFGEQKTIPLTVTNAGNVPWPATGPNPVNLSYHMYGPSGEVVLWDGPRTPLGGDVLPGQAKSLSLTYMAPGAAGTYTIAVDLVKEGVSWFSDLGSPPLRHAVAISSGLVAGYGATTTPPQVTLGAVVQLTVDVTNYGGRVWTNGGPSPIRLSYHLYDGAGRIAVWDGNRGILPSDVRPVAMGGSSVTVPISVALPNTTGNYTLAWDMVMEGFGWFSQFGVQPKNEQVAVVPGVTFYGKGFGHGVGMSQWGAQGLASGAAGVPLTGEQIVGWYYQGTTLMPVAQVDPARGALRVLLSQPSSQSRYNCSGVAYFAGNLANVVSAGGFRVLNESSNPPNQIIGNAGPGVTFQFLATRGIVQVWNQATAQPTIVYEGAGPVVAQPLDPSVPTNVQEKGVYRGNFKFSNLGGTLRIVNYVNYDEYVRGVIPLEMLGGWNLEAYKAQALAARSYAFTSYRGGSSDYDVSDDQSDQCYGGVKMLNGRQIETPITDQAAALTASKIVTFQGQPVRTYFASSSGGYTKAFGCWMNNVVRSGGTWACSPTAGGLTAVPDPADLRVSAPSTNPRASWSATFTGTQLQSAILRCNQVDIGSLQAVDVSNQSPANVGHVVSVRVFGSFANVDLRADQFLTGCLGLRSTMVRLSPF